MVEGLPFEPTFYRNVDVDDMFRYLIEIKRYQKHASRCTVNYFLKYREVFFGREPTELLKLSPRKRSWILSSLRHFGSYYNYKTGNPECRELVDKIIDRFGLNTGFDNQRKVYLVDDDYVKKRVSALLKIEGQIGLTVKVGLFSGLREEEILYIHRMEICCNLGRCDCSKLHVTNKQNGTSVIVINWFRGHKKCYFTLLPTRLWNEFRQLEHFSMADIQATHKLIKSNADVMYVELRKLHYNVMTRVFDTNEADVLAGRAKSVAARHYAMYKLDRMAERYLLAWQKFDACMQRSSPKDLTKQ
jgi:intergrase/recombinase